MKPNLHKYVTIGKTYMLTDDGMAIVSMRDSTIKSHLDTNEYWLTHKERLQGKTIYEWRDEKQKTKEVDTGYKGHLASYWYKKYKGKHASNKFKIGSLLLLSTTNDSYDVLDMKKDFSFLRDAKNSSCTNCGFWAKNKWINKKYFVLEY